MLQFYGETFLLALFALVLALVFVAILLPSFNIIAEKHLELNLNNPILLLGVTTVILLTTLFAGSYPALLLSSFHPSKIFKESSSGLKKTSIRWVLVVFQFTVSIVLIILTITMNNQINYIRNKNLGFNRNQVLSLPLNDELVKQYETFKNELLQNSNITHVTAASSSPNNVGNINPVYWEGTGPDQYQQFNFVSLDYDYFVTFEMDIVKGRSFSKEFSTDRQNYIVNEAAVNFMKMDDPIGKLFSIWTNEGRIIGVVKDFHSTSLHNKIGPVVMTFTQYTPLSQGFIRIIPNNVKETLTDIEKIWKKYAPDFPFQYEFLDNNFQRQYVNEEKIETLFKYFSFLAIFISCIGLFGLSVFVAQKRTKEIGVRKVVGATVFAITWLILKDFSKWLVLAIILAIPISYYAMLKWLANFAYKTDITWTIFFSACMIVFAIAILTTSWQAIRAARANPSESLKYE